MSVLGWVPLAAVLGGLRSLRRARATAYDLAVRDHDHSRVDRDRNATGRSDCPSDPRRPSSERTSERSGQFDKAGVPGAEEGVMVTGCRRGGRADGSSGPRERARPADRTHGIRTRRGSPGSTSDCPVTSRGPPGGGGRGRRCRRSGNAAADRVSTRSGRPRMSAGSPRSRAAFHSGRRRSRTTDTRSRGSRRQGTHLAPPRRTDRDSIDADVAVGVRRRSGSARR